MPAKDIRVRVEYKNKFQDNLFQTITIDKEKNIKASIGQLKEKNVTAIQCFIFPYKKGKAIDKAVSWTKEAGKTIKEDVIKYYNKLPETWTSSGMDLQKVIAEVKMEDLKTHVIEKSMSKEVEILKVAAKKKIVYAIVFSPDDPDAYDTFMSVETIEQMAYRWMTASRAMDENHDWVKGAGLPVESFIVREGDKDFVDENGKARVGAWVLATKVIDERVWKAILKGEIKSYSIAGVARYGKEKELDSKWVDEDGKRVDPFEED